MVKSCYAWQEGEQSLLDEGVTAVLVLQDQFADLVKVSHHELAADSAGTALDLHPLTPGIALRKAGKSMNGRTTMREVRLHICTREEICLVYSHIK